MSNTTVKYIDRATGKLCIETVMGEKALNFAYNTLAGRTLWGMLFNSGFFSSLMGIYYDSPISKKSITSLLKIPGIHPEEAEFHWQKYHSFNDFFARRLKPGSRPAAAGDNILSSPADGRILVYPEISPDKAMPVKGAMRNLNFLCAGELTAQKYSVAVVRLAPIDYHRYHYPCDCSDCGNIKSIPGKYHSVNPIAFKKAPDVFVENSRVITELTSPVFGKFFYLDVGAFGVGSIVNTGKPGEHAKMDEKGYSCHGI